MEWIFTLKDIQETALSFWKAIQDKRVVAFHGLMGTGKTTFIHAMCDVKKVRETVGSPTFSLINEYTFDENGKERKIYHIDLYRLKSESEAFDAGIEDCLYSDHICLLEWPEKAPSILPEDTVHVFIESIDANKRRLIIKDK
ncbi:MAG TPA: tRNA (adenosine(37)-N6)-threonylcarbamoyltransferase complex ATPase subunit type 1 TsaE [Chitinophagaceae bacterium]|jgi:tRNA threonylcarbamoyladenosine biosynthesis protein TsaE|nr:tRNA (adenosine(37)-N6)-threonylcarbamoyltransferase complex ATPase subunit type 1 TsaE [Chitinophagaceae bacterium]